MQVGRGDTAGGSDEPNLLAALHRVADRHVLPAHMEVARHQAVAMVDVDDVAR